MLDAVMDFCSGPPMQNHSGVDNMMGFHIDYDPAPILWVLPNLEMAQAYSKDRLDPMLRSCTPGPSAWGVDLTGGCIKSHQPVLAVRRRRQGEPDWFGVRIEEQQEVVVGDPPTHRVELGDRVAVEKDHQAAGKS